MWVGSAGVLCRGAPASLKIRGSRLKPLAFARCSGPGVLSDPKRGPGRPPVRLTSQPSLGGRTSKRGTAGRLGDPAAGPTGTNAYGTNELIGRKIWCDLPAHFRIQLLCISVNGWNCS